VAAKSRRFTADKTGKGQFLRGNRRNLAGEVVVRKSSSPQRVASASIGARGQGTWATRSAAPDLASESFEQGFELYNYKHPESSKTKQPVGVIF